KTYTSALKANQQSPNIMFMPATDIYKANAGDGTLTKAAHEGKEVALFITGGKDCNKATFMEKGWSTVNSISQHIAKTFNADNLSSLEKEEIYSSME
ncbi:hypothetical protein IJ670_03445, partial [bacterium]|nr:hypothetical protein [bacterium]